MRILVVNVNTTESMTASIGEQARAVAGPGTEIVALTPFFGADSVEGNVESYLTAVAVLDRVLAYEEPFDAPRPKTVPHWPLHRTLNVDDRIGVLAREG